VPGRIKAAYAFLAVLFIGTVAFQIAMSSTSLRETWAYAPHLSSGTLTAWALLFFAHVLAPFACLFLGFYVATVRIWDRRAWLLLAVLLSFGLAADGANTRDEVMAWHTWFKHLALAFRSTGVYTFPFWLAAFAIYFPEQAEWEQRRPVWKWLFLAPIAALTGLMSLVRAAANEVNSPRLVHARDIVSRYWTVAFYICVLFFLLVLSLKLASAKAPDNRRRLRVLLFGIALTLVPLSGLDLLSRFLNMEEDKLPPWLLVPVFPVILAFPVTIAYVTVVQRALDLGVVIRQSLQYALARRGVVVLQIVISILVVLVVADLAGQLSFGQRILLTAIGIAAVLLTGVGARWLANWIDRRFFREAHNAEQILSRLAESVSSMVELGPLLTTVAARIAEALHISEIAIFLRERNAFRPAFALGYNHTEELAVDDSAPLVQELRRRRTALRTYGEEQRSWVPKPDGAEAKFLRQLDAQILLPLARKDELLGFITLGPRQAEAPYSASDVNLLQSVASQTALAVENSRLTSTIATEAAQREIIQRELEIAREVQQRLFPQTCPRIPGLSYYGTCRPAREVGGDYYDFLELPERGLGLAIGDVSGKGVPAALLMASLQAALRGQTLAASASIHCIVENLNRLIYAATPANRYATFFYGQYEPVSRRLVYVNAGHNAPILLRPNQGATECIRLEAGGPPVGLLPQATYQSGELDLYPGDLLIIFTDGVSESMNSAEEEWGEDRLIQSLNQVGHCCPAALVEAVFKAADAFAAGAPQHDDMTLVVFRVVLDT